jgi:non-ribosomal peptide synthetase component E (peptide arylation enzyme)
MNLKQMLERAAERYAGKTVIVSDKRRLSYAELDVSPCYCPTAPSSWLSTSG